MNKKIIIGGVILSTIIVTVIIFTIFSMTFLGLFSFSKTGNTENIVTKKIEEQNVEDYDKSLSKQLKFKDIDVEISRMGSGDAEYSFWFQEAKTLQSDELGKDYYTINMNYSIDDLLYDSMLDHYYYSEPSGYKTIKIISLVELEQLASLEKEVLDEELEIITNTKCQYINMDYNSVNNPWMAVQCDTQIKTKDVEYIVDASKIVNCYIPIENTNKYLAFEQTGSSLSSEIDVCQELSIMGIQSVSRVK
jgi:hypothetical protein